MRIIHIVENLDKGAVENWLVNCFIESREYQPEYEWTFYCILGRKGRLDELVLQHAGKIIYSPVDIGNKFTFLSALRKVLIKGNYDIIHSHHDYMSGFYLLASIGIKFRKRLLHVHNTDRGLPVGNKKLEWIFLRVFWLSGFLLSDKILCISGDVLAHYLGKNRRKKGRLLYYGIDLKKFGIHSDYDVKKELGINKDSKIILFTGRLNELKNPVFCIDILYCLIKKDKNIHLVIAGKGEKEEEVIKKVTEYQLQNHVHLLGWRNDIPEIMKSADLFIFPRVEYPVEGLGIVMIEAQAAALPTLISRGIVKDTFIIGSLIHVLPLENNPLQWADTALQILTIPRMDQQRALQIMEDSVFSLHHGMEKLLSFYE